MTISTRKTLDPFHDPPHALRKDLFGLEVDCNPLRVGLLSMRKQLEELSYTAPPGQFNRRTAAMLADFSRIAYRDRPVDSDFPVGSLRRPFVPHSSCGVFVALGPGIISVDGAQLLILRNGYEEFIVAFRGTQEAGDFDGDWLRNMNILPIEYGRADDLGENRSRLHAGFYNGYRAIEGPLEQILKSRLTPDSRVYFTGHSQGGAIATIAALDTAVKIEHGDFPRIPIAMYSFGNPRAMNRRCVDVLYEKLVPESFSVLFEKDPVGKMPPLTRRPAEEPYGYSHIHNVVLINGEVFAPGQDVAISFLDGREYRPEAVGVKGAIQDQDSHGIGKYRNLLRRDQDLRSS